MEIVLKYLCIYSNEYNHNLICNLNKTLVLYIISLKYVLKLLITIKGHFFKSSIRNKCQTNKNRIQIEIR